ncbi:hypothetical protein L0222_12625 [bacterium]|nr:hypothetical protein [bacterium]MCI0606999.1 hypothetical protein [bacterium]
MILNEMLGLIPLLYAGPDQLMPIASIIGSLIGILLIWWRAILGAVRKTWKSFRKSNQ